jgi:hypothetical protein
VLLLPPAPAALVLLGRTFATFSFWSAAALLRIAVFGPPGGVGDEGRPAFWLIAPPGEFTGDDARGEDCDDIIVSHEHEQRSRGWLKESRVSNRHYRQMSAGTRLDPSYHCIPVNISVDVSDL